MTVPLFLEALIYGIRDVLNSSHVAFTRKSRIELGANLTGTVDEANNCIRIDATSGGSGTPGGADKDVQINDGGSLGADTGNLTYDKTLHSMTVGEGCSATGANAFAAGSGCAAGANGVAMGVGSTATTDACALGDNCTASGTASFACGLSATASRWGEFAHCSDPPTDFDGTHGIDVGATGSGALDLSLGSAADIILIDSRVYSIRVRLIAAKVGGTVCAHEVHELLAHGDGHGNLVIDEDDLISAPAVDFAAVGYTSTIAAPTGMVLRVSCNAGADTVNFGARVEWSSIGAT